MKALQARYQLTVWALVCLGAASPGAAATSQPWDAPAFSAPAAEVARAAAAVQTEQAADVVVLLDEQRYEFDANNRLKATYHLVYRVDSPEGVRSWAAAASYWHPWHEEQPRIRARVITADGVEHLLDPAVLSDAPGRDDAPNVYQDDRIYSGPLPAVAVGAVVEREVVSIDTEPFFAGGIFQRIPVGRSVPVQQTRVTLDAPAALALRHQVRLLPDAKIRESRSDEHVSWVLEHGPLSALEAPEANLPSDVPRRPQIELSTGESWQQVARTYAAMTEPKLPIEDVRPLIGAPVSGESSVDTAARIVSRLHREVRYTGVEFGEAQLIPQFPQETLKRKFGDCKDKAALLAAMLRGAGLPAYLALLSTGPGYDSVPDLPGLGGFDHAIVFMPGTPDLWIDATAEYTRVGELPEADQGRLALVIREETTGLTRTPEASSAQNINIERRTFQLAERGASSVVEITEPHGNAEASYRTAYAGPRQEPMRKELESYVQLTYLAESLKKYEPSATDDFRGPFQLRLEVEKARRGLTDDDSAVVAVLLSGIANGLPSYLTEERPDSTSESTSQAGARKPRTADVVFSPFVTEWRYHVVPPPGFRVRGLPSNTTRELGPARLTQEYAVDASGAVDATYRFDTVKSRYSPVEAESVRSALKELNEAPAVIIGFELTASALLAAGDFRGALQAYEDLAELHPKEALHHVQLASGLLGIGLAERARREAQAATKLEPSSALAWQTLGWILQHDLVGRRFGKGFDRAGAIAAYRKAKSLDPKDLEIRGDLAILLEYDADGERYAPASQLAEAIAEYGERKALIREDEEDTLENNPIFALFYAGRFQEVVDAVKKLGPNDTTQQLELGSVAVVSGVSAALEGSYRLGSDETERAKTLSGAANYLIRVRRYDLAADLLSSALQGQTRSAASLQQIDMLRKTKRHEELTATDGPDGVARRFFRMAISRAPQSKEIRGLWSRRLLAGLSEEDASGAVEQFAKGMRSSRSTLGLLDDVLADITLSNITTKSEGEDGIGYRVHVEAAGRSVDMFVVKEEGQYRLLTAPPVLAPLGQLALERLAAGDEHGARQCLDWARESVRFSSGDDRLGGPIFPRLWSKGQSADVIAIRAAAASLLAGSPSAKSAIDPLLVLRARAEPASEAYLNATLALASTYLTLERWEELHELSQELMKLAPDSQVAFVFLVRANRALQRWDELKDSARSRLERIPDDSSALLALAEEAEDRHEFERIRNLLRPMIASSRASALEYNRFAWYGLLTPPVDQEIIEAARKAYAQSEGKTFGITHTLACVYAAANQPKQARELLLETMERFGIAEPDDELWYGFGLVADAYGDVDSARTYYERVTKPKKARGDTPPRSSYALAQARLAVLGKP